MSNDDTGDFIPALGCLVGPAIADLAARLGSIAGLGQPERDAFCAGVTEALYETVHRHVSRVLVLELNAARVTGQLRAGSERERWDEFLALANDRAYWDGLSEPYPNLMVQLDRLIGNRIRASAQLGERFAADRASIGLGELRKVAFGAGDSHRGGQTVAILDCADGPIVYKPRSMRIDAELGAFVARLPTHVRVPSVIQRGGYGWAEHVTHRHCADESELASFYRGIGHWLAVMRLVGGVDLHAENLIACGPVPVVVDCETLFMPILPGIVSGDGQAVDLATDMIDATVLRTGLLPGRGIVLGWRGVDNSAVGALPGQQPVWDQPAIIDAGSDRARIGVERVEMPVSANHPSAQPELARYWGEVMTGFDELAGHLVGLDRAGELEPMLAAFADCPIRVVARVTEAYAEVARMLWHPVSLHDPEPAFGRAARLLAKMHELLPVAPNDPDVIRAEIEDLLDGDIPFFTTVAGVGRLDGPRGTKWMPEKDLVRDALERWRATGLDLERRFIQATLVSAYLNEGWTPGEEPMSAGSLDMSNLDKRRRMLAAGIMQRLVDTAIRGHDDGTVTWIAPILNDTGWSVQHLGRDLYAGSHGVALLLAGYQREVRMGRADAVAGLDELLHGIVLTVKKIEDRGAKQRADGLVMRPEPPGGYIGLGSQIWSWLTLERFGFAEGPQRALALAELLPAAVEADQAYDILLGMAGAIAPLLQLARRTGDDRWTDLAAGIAQRLAKAARVDGRGARWPATRWPDGIGGFAHGATGIGWALSLVPGFEKLSRAAAEFEESTYDAHARGWRDLRQPSMTAAAWCHGSVGIGLSAVDPSLRRRAADVTWRDGMGWNHTLCHGDLGAWELLRDHIERSTLDAYVIGSLERNGPVSGLARDTFSPGLLPGLGGVAYQLLRMHDECDLPSVLIQHGN
ncbi:type 2 lanthipeptide synthetase LanM family protein [Allorhizocola rhizosphaerae]|uniref:type 2 lanthipeptide synthetase LanM family protein n=1 Tax=Allorhizocola rhizosphaerae TaxID=1872709 RepID=UPI001FE47864|nr:type 2 lanthipeptide synthetase LanM family protein [Allorhizocola rhizosphaerae]